MLRPWRDRSTAFRRRVVVDAQRHDVAERLRGVDVALQVELRDLLQVRDVADIVDFCEIRLSGEASWWLTKT